VSLLEQVIEAHGGRDAWHGREGFEIEATVGGIAWPMRTRRRPGRFVGRVRTDRPWMEVLDYPAEGRRGVFEPERVSIEAVKERCLSPIFQRTDPRESFRRLSRQFHWDDLDLLYFAGYAWWNYLAFPFYLEDQDVEQLPGRRLGVRFAEGFPAHSREQVFHLDDEFRLVRNDYTADVFGPYARARHESGEHRWFDGLLVPTRRRVYLRGLPWPVIISLDISAVRALA
jgi:hypothetical protein